MIAFCVCMRVSVCVIYPFNVENEQEKKVMTNNWWELSVFSHSRRGGS